MKKEPKEKDPKDPKEEKELEEEVEEEEENKCYDFHYLSYYFCYVYKFLLILVLP